MLNPRLNDAFGLPFSQDDVPFLIPHLREDLPLCIDPFLLWNSDIQGWKELHNQLLDFVDEVRRLSLDGDLSRAVELLLGCQEQPALGLGYAEGTKAGQSIGPALARSVAAIFLEVPQLHDSPPRHLEEVQLLVPRVKEDRLSDITGAVLKEYLINYTAEQAKEYGIPTRKVMVDSIWDNEDKRWRPGGRAALPFNPSDQTPILLPPLAWLRTLPWINYVDYFRSHYSLFVLPSKKPMPKAQVLAYNRSNYEQVERYVKKKEELGSRAFPEYYFTPMNVKALRRRAGKITALPTGKEEGADKEYETGCFEFLQSILYPDLDYAGSQVRTVSGTHIRDVVFHNDAKTDFLKEIKDRYGVRQLVFELKNVKTSEPEHINQLYRYLGGDFGTLGVLVARTPSPPAVQRNIIDLHSGHGYVILVLDDRDLHTMVALKEAGGSAIPILKKKMIEFQRRLPR